ncbi:MAG: hypothetical protein HW380_1817 [Magnetococcales bacterium]|nr:hypothetical protein [Magnetococcales bacterium]
MDLQRQAQTTARSQNFSQATMRRSGRKVCTLPAWLQPDGIVAGHPPLDPVFLFRIGFITENKFDFTGAVNGKMGQGGFGREGDPIQVFGNVAADTTGFHGHPFAPFLETIDERCQVWRGQGFATREKNIVQAGCLVFQGMNTFGKAEDTPECGVAVAWFITPWTGERAAPKTNKNERPSHHPPFPLNRGEKIANGKCRGIGIHRNEESTARVQFYGPGEKKLEKWKNIIGDFHAHPLYPGVFPGQRMF